ncbi:MAG TPA: NAD(P)-binding domain-containing protein [Actinomycetota bacterium]|jgi:putative flavoprotein involved in K+ transport
MERVDVVVVGAGQAGLSTSHELTRLGVDHVVLEGGRVGQTWRGRWDSFCLVTPNWSILLPGGRYDGDDPDGYLPRDDLVAYFEGYAQRFGAPVREDTEVSALRPDGEGFSLSTSDGDLKARQVVLATGAYPSPHRPHEDTLPPDVFRIGVEEYTNESALPPGRVLVVGSGQSGCQLTEEFLDAGREVVLACGRAPWVRRRAAGRDVVWWVLNSGFMDGGVETLRSPGERLAANILSTGHGGGHDLHYRTLRDRGATLVGRFQGVDGPRVRFGGDLGESVAWGDERYLSLRDLFRRFASERGVDPPDWPDPEPFDGTAPEELDLADFAVVVFAGGFRPDYSWLPWPGLVDDLGYPVHREGQSTAVPGLWFVGVHYLRKRKSSLLMGVGEDATIVAEGVRAGLG